MQYFNFTLEIRPGADSLQTRVEAPYATEYESFNLPFQEGELTDLLSKLEECVPNSEKMGAAVHQKGWPGAHVVGSRLFGSFMTSTVAPAFYRSLGNIEGMDNRERRIGLRLRLRFVGFEDEEAPREVMSLPWELLRDPLDGYFLGLGVSTPIVRFLDVPSPMPVRVPSRLKVLIVKSEPDDLNGLQSEEESQAITQALKALDDLALDYLENPTLRSLRHHMRDGRPHVLHFIGHGGFDSESGCGELAFCKPAGGHRLVPGDAVGEQLRDCNGDLRLVILNSCYSSALPSAGGQNLFSGIASAFVKAGIPAVVAMQFPITNAGAIAFTRGFYNALAAGDPIDAAVGEGRLEIKDSNHDSLEWITPVLFMSSEHGHIVRFGRESGTDDVEEDGMAVPKAERPDRLRLSIRSFSGHGVEQDKQADRFLDLRRFFDGRFIKDDQLWASEIYPRVQEFLRQNTRSGQRVHLSLAAHSTIAFAIGYCLEVKSGIEVAMVQRGPRGSIDWEKGQGIEGDEPFWKAEENRPLRPGASDVAVAISLKHNILQDVEYYLQKGDLDVCRILPATLKPKPSADGVKDWDHSFELAQQLEGRIRARSIEERQGTLHIFAAAPNAFIFHLGQLSRGFGSLQLYEYDFDTGAPGAYRPSLNLPLQNPQEGGPK